MVGGGRPAGKTREKQLTHALLESLIIIRGMLTTDNYSVNPVEYFAISYCEREWRAWPRWCHVYYFEKVLPFNV